MKLTTIVRAIALLGLAAPALAQTSAPAQRVEITGSSIKRIASEGALPVDVIRRADIERLGVSTVEQLMATLVVAGNGTDNLASLGGNASQGSSANPDGNNNLGNSSINLRGLGPQNTLVLLNGRRQSNHGLKGATVDLATIPLAAIDRIEILRDGASAIYGTDAIGGVVNFILRRDYNGLEATVGTDITQDGGGAIHKFSGVWGMGSLDAQRFNVMLALSGSRNQTLTSRQRDFASLGHDPANGVAQETVGTPYATQIATTNAGNWTALTRPGAAAPIRFNSANLLALNGNCNSVADMYPYADAVTGVTSRRYGCSYDYAGRAMLQQPLDVVSLVSRVNFQLSPNHLAYVELIGSRAEARKEYEPMQVTSSTASDRYSYPVNGPYYQNLNLLYPNLTAQTGMTFNANKPIGIRWRCNECGTRISDTTSSNHRLVAGLEGSLGAYDYKLGLLAGKAKSRVILTQGYFYDDALDAALDTGLINPWLAPGQSQTAAGMAALDGARADGIERLNGSTHIYQADATLSGQLMQLPAGALSFALGLDLRQEGYELRYNEAVLYAALPDADFSSRKRDITAVFGELLVPVTKQIELTLALRSDRYSDFGSTTNPKIGLRVQPAKNLMLRASASTGFRAPSFGQLYQSATDINGTLPQITSARDDPTAVCSGPGALVGAARDGYCGVRFDYLTGGNPKLKPEESKQWSVGFVVEPTDWLSISLDTWRVNRTNVIGFLSPEAILNNYSVLSEFAIRGPDGKIDYLRAGRINAAGTVTGGTDIGINLRGLMGQGRWSASFGGAYLDTHKDRLFDNQPWVEWVGRFSNQDLRLRWKHSLAFTYSQGAWSATTSQSYSRGHDAYVWPTGVTQPGGKVEDYIRYNLSASYSGFKSLTLNAGIRNLFNTDPPYSIHHSDEVSGTSWDPRVGDPRGRSFYLNATYKFF
jgi:iron complex outermembrane recepter protein